MVLFEFTIFETYYRFGKTWKFAYYFLHFSYFHIFFTFLHICIYFAYFFCIFCSFTVKHFIKLYNADSDWRLSISSRCFLVCCCNSRVKRHAFNFTDTIKNMLTNFNSTYHYAYSIIMRTLSKENFIFLNS